MSRVYITGKGIISSLGLNVEENLAALREGKSGIGKANYFRSNFADNYFFGEVGLNDDQLQSICGVSDEKELTSTTLLAMCAFSEAIQDAGLSATDVGSFSTAFISSSTVGGMCYTDELYTDANMKGSPSDYVKSYEGSDHTLRIIRKYGIVGYSDTINTACSSSANAVLLGAKLIKTGRVSRAIVGGTDCLAKYTVNGFNSLMILSDQACMPFDRNRSGLTLGEAAAYIVLENEKASENKKRFAEVTGFGNASDAFHPSATSEEARGPINAMRKALASAKLHPDQIEYINAHGTGTVNNDFTESYAFSNIFNKVPPYNSTKSYTGHTLAAAGASELIFSTLSMMHSELYPSLRCKEPIEEFDFKPLDCYAPNVNINNIISNSFGFGGNCTSIVLSKCS
jgi:3-oxoacyl-(acyl-carrier-protein) synthase